MSARLTGDGEPVDPAAQGWSVWRESGLEGLLGDVWKRREGERWAYGFVAAERHRNRGGIVHGGMLMTFADHCLGSVVWSVIEGQRAVTMQLNTSFVSAALVGDFVETRPEVIRITNSVVFMRGALTVGGETVVSAEGVWKRLRQRPAR